MKNITAPLFLVVRNGARPIVRPNGATLPGNPWLVESPDREPLAYQDNFGRWWAFEDVESATLSPADRSGAKSGLEIEQEKGVARARVNFPIARLTGRLRSLYIQEFIAHYGRLPDSESRFSQWREVIEAREILAAFGDVDVPPMDAVRLAHSAAALVLPIFGGRSDVPKNALDKVQYVLSGGQAGADELARIAWSVRKAGYDACRLHDEKNWPMHAAFVIAQAVDAASFAVRAEAAAEDAACYARRQDAYAVLHKPMAEAEAAQATRSAVAEAARALVSAYDVLPWNASAPIMQGVLDLTG